jgi:hypothetical protein
MPSVKLKTNMIIEGHFFKFGTMIDENKVPPRYRTRKFILREGEIDYREREREKQMAMAEQELDSINEDNELDLGEGNKVPRRGNRRL